MIAYFSSEQWNCLVSSFFLDTASNVLRYLELIYTILKPGGVLINIGKYQPRKPSSLPQALLPGIFQTRNQVALHS